MLRSLYMKHTCFLFKCRLRFRLRFFSNATFGTLALYILRLKCLAIPNTSKNSFWFFRKRGLHRFLLHAIVLLICVQTFPKILGDFTETKTPTFQIDFEYVPKLSVWALLCFLLWWQPKKCFDNFLRSLYLEQYVFLFECRVMFQLHQLSKATFGTSALYILRLRCLVISNTYKKSICFLSKTETFQDDVEYVPKMSVWPLLGLILWL